MANRRAADAKAVLPLWNEGKSMNAIARELGCSVMTVKRRLVESGIDTSSISHGSGAQRHYDVEADKHWENIKADFESGMSVVAVRKKYNMTKERVLALCERHEYALSDVQANVAQEMNDKYKRQLVSMREANMSVAEMAAVLGKSERTVGRHLQNFGLTQGTARTDITDEAVRALWDSGLTVIEIASKFSCAHDTITKRLDAMGIEYGRASSIRKHFERTHTDLWPDAYKALSYGRGITVVAKALHVRTQTVAKLIEANGFSDDAPLAGLSAKLRDYILNIDGMSPDAGIMRKYASGILSYYSVFDKRPSLVELSDFLGVQPDTARQFVARCGLCLYMGNRNLSDFEARLVADLDAIGIQYELNRRDIISNDDGSVFELDIYVPALRLGIEINPTFTHSVDGSVRPVSRQYHQAKALAAERAGIGLLHVYDDDLMDERKYNVLLTQLRSRGHDLVRYGARECAVREVTREDCNAFLDEFHFQGGLGAKCSRLGLWRGDVLVGVLVIGPARYSDHEFEILRYCMRPGHAVTGGFQKMFRAFLDGCAEPADIMSYMDMNKRFSVSNVYEKNGFECLGLTEPDYAWYKLNGFDVLSRYMTTKAKLAEQGYDVSKTEVEIMTGRGYARVFRAGSKRYVYHHRP